MKWDLFIFSPKKKHIQTIAFPNQYYLGEKYTAKKFLRSSTKTRHLKIHLTSL